MHADEVECSARIFSFGTGITALRWQSESSTDEVGTMTIPRGSCGERDLLSVYHMFDGVAAQGLLADSHLLQRLRTRAALVM